MDSLADIGVLSLGSKVFSKSDLNPPGGEFEFVLAVLVVLDILSIEFKRTKPFFVILWLLDFLDGSCVFSPNLGDVGLL